MSLLIVCAGLINEDNHSFYETFEKLPKQSLEHSDAAISYIISKV